MHWVPNFSAPLLSSDGSCTALVLMLTLSAPARRICWISSTERIPPPTVRGRKSWSAARSITSMMVPRCSFDAVMSRKTTSSAPCSLYRCASSTGSPASLKSRKWVPFTTLPPFRSRQGMIRRVSVMERVWVRRG
ncbi:MAG: hypothetical protein A4E41_00652 [Methanoregulaceae archaeon PtaU1.Bin066]|nr:MAG: hypothetical protein A4E41_00652 [Methanoregulaceae archaeon PtaU1.Bin066]